VLVIRPLAQSGADKMKRRSFRGDRRSGAPAWASNMSVPRRLNGAPDSPPHRPIH